MSMLKKGNGNSSIDFARVNEIAATHIEKILTHFKIPYKVYSDRVALSCPIHGSTGEESLTLYTTGKKYVGNFVCWTHHCEEKGRGAVNLIMHLLNSNSILGAAKWILEFTNSPTPEADEEYKQKKRFNSTVSGFEIKSKKKVGITRDLVRKSLLIPGDFYIKRGFSKEILDKYDVGFCNTRGKEMFMRTVVPVYEDGFMIGCVGRSINPECSACGMFHKPGNPCPEQKSRIYAKWVNSDGFTTGANFYNLWNAQEYIKKTQNVILVEGQGDIWRLEESGIKIGLGLFGNKITPEQCKILEMTGAMNLFLALDSDEPGKEGKTMIREKLGRFYNICEIQLPEHDLGDIQDLDKIRKIFKGIQTE